MMLSGWDMGHAVVKAVLMQDTTCLASALCPHSGNPGGAAEQLWKQLTECTGLFPSDMDWNAATGIFASQAPRLDGSFPMAAALARGTAWLCPDVRRVVDIGHQTALCVDFEKGGRILHTLAPLPEFEGIGAILGLMTTLPPSSPSQPCAEAPPKSQKTSQLRIRAIDAWIRSLGGENHTQELIRDLAVCLKRSLPFPSHKSFLLAGSLALTPAFQEMRSQRGPCLLRRESPFTAALGAALLSRENAGQGIPPRPSRKTLTHQHA